MAKNIKEKVIGATGSISGAASIMGSWQICHSLCLGLITLLGIVGITITGMPLLFLTKVAVPIWIIAALLLLATIIVYMSKKCISKNLIIFNSGLIIAGTPFSSLQQFSALLWTAGGLVSAAGIFLFVKERIGNKKGNHKNDYIIYGILAVALVILLYTVFGLLTNNAETAIPQSNKDASASNFKTISTGSTEPGSAQVDLTPQDASNGQLKVGFAINTHSVDLSQYDLEKIATLEYNGKQISPVNAPKLEGHHNSGTLIFNVDQNLNKFKIIIVGIPNVQERVFEWK